MQTNKFRYTSRDMCETLNMSQSALSKHVGGTEVRRNGRVEWSAAPLLVEDADYTRVIENGRAKIYYADSAITKIKQKRGGE